MRDDKSFTTGHQTVEVNKYEHHVYHGGDGKAEASLLARV